MCDLERIHEILYDRFHVSTSYKKIKKRKKAMASEQGRSIVFISFFFFLILLFLRRFLDISFSFLLSFYVWLSAPGNFDFFQWQALYLANASGNSELSPSHEKVPCAVSEFLEYWRYGVAERRSGEGRGSVCSRLHFRSAISFLLVSSSSSSFSLSFSLFFPSPSISFSLLLRVSFSLILRNLSCRM